MKVLIPILPLLLATACAAPAPSDGSCGAARWSGDLGRDAASLSKPADRPWRVVGPDTMVTMDYRPERVNFRTDADGRLTEVTCG